MNRTRLFRSRRNRMIAGVAGGLAEYFEVDVVLIRLLWILAFFMGGGGLLAYIIAWIIIPEEKTVPNENTAFQTDEPGQFNVGTEPPVEDYRDRTEFRKHRTLIIGSIFIFIGLIFLVREFLPWDLTRYLWPLLLIGLGIYLLARRRRE